MAVRILIQNPKTPFNVGSAIRAAACYDAVSVHWTGNRISRSVAMRNSKVANPRKAARLPREERIRSYEHIDFGEVSEERAIEMLSRTPSVVIIELLRGAQPLTWFAHPTTAEAGFDVLYVFGPEDGNVKREWREHGHSFVFIPTRHCINLAAAVYTVLYDRQTKEAIEGRTVIRSMEESLA